MFQSFLGSLGVPRQAQKGPKRSNSLSPAFGRPWGTLGPSNGLSTVHEGRLAKKVSLPRAYLRPMKEGLPKGEPSKGLSTVREGRLAKR